MTQGKGKEKVGETTETNNKGKGVRFNTAHLKEIVGYERGRNFVEVGCGCTNRKYGDFGGRLRIQHTGEFSITCHCYEGCEKVNVTPKEFEKHVGKETRKWTSNIWVQIDGEKVPLEKSKVMKYYNHKANAKNWSKFVSRNKKFHKDEFIRCSKCNKERRFRRRSAKEMKEYHDALNNKNWECSEWHYNKITCDEEEERDNRKMYRGCPAIKHCRGCNYCICNGCLKCRFLNCNCQPCTDFMTEAKP